MKHWVIVDDLTKARAVVNTEILDVATQEEAVNIATARWEKLSFLDRRRRDAYFLCRAEVDEDGVVDFDTLEEIKAFKK